jgi:hypothetical protein
LQAVYSELSLEAMTPLSDPLENRVARERVLHRRFRKGPAQPPLDMASNLAGLQTISVFAQNLFDGPEDLPLRWPTPPLKPEI